MTEQNVFRWLLDVDPLWKTPFDGEEPFKSTELWSKGEDAQRALDLLPDEERTKVLKFYRHTDAKLCLGSCLLKRRAVSKTCGIPWTDVKIGEDNHRKPCYVPCDPIAKTLQFNVSHHGTLVALVGCPGTNVDLGVDIVKLNWEKDCAKVMREGFEAWANTYEMVFSDREMRDISSYAPANCRTTADVVKAQLRHFYAHWCLKEAYVKMTGEALMASSLKQMEFRNVEVPNPSPDSEWGELCEKVETWFGGEKVEHIGLQIQAFREDYMIATCTSKQAVAIGSIKLLSRVQDVYPSTAF